jgi:hypothetical protein
MLRAEVLNPWPDDVFCVAHIILIGVLAILTKGFCGILSLFCQIHIVP